VNGASQQPEAPVAPVQSPESHQIDRFLRAEPSPTSVITTLDPAVPPDPSYRKQPKGRLKFLSLRDDYGSGATANCLKIVHGGLRYLQHGEPEAGTSVRNGTERLAALRPTWWNRYPSWSRPIVAGSHRGRFSRLRWP
jgi:hypothetical protein